MFLRPQVLSSNALSSLSPDHLRAVGDCFDSKVVVDIPVIERVGGGGIRCEGKNHIELREFPQVIFFKKIQVHAGGEPPPGREAGVKN